MVFLLAALLIAALPAIAQSNVAPVNLANLRAANALVGMGPVDIYLNGERIAFSLAPETATPYFAIPSGKHRMEVRLPDSDPLDAPIADALLDLAPNQSETAIVYQKQFAEPGGYTPPHPQAGAIISIDDDRSPVSLGNTRVTAVHLASGAPPVLSVAYPSRESLLHRVAFEQPFGTIDVDARIYTLALVDADSPDLAVLARLGDISLYANTLYTVIIVPDVRPSVNERGIPGVVERTARPRAFVISAPIDPPPNGLHLRLIHAAHNTAVLDIYIDERLVAERVNYSRATEYLGLAGYSHVITLRRAGASPSSPPLARAEFTITPENLKQTHWSLVMLNAGREDTSAALPVSQPGERETSRIINTPDGQMFMVLLPDNIAQTQRGYARIRLLNAANDIQPLRILAPTVPLPPGSPPAEPLPPDSPTPAPQQLVQDVVFAAEANEVEVPAGLYPALNFVPVGGVTPLVSLENVQMVSGMVYTFVAMGSPVGNPPISITAFSDYGIGLPLDRLYLGRITTLNANIRVGASANAGILRQLPRDTEVEVLGRNLNGEWIRIRFADPDTRVTREGWISGTANIITVTRLGVPVNVLALPQYVAPGG